MKLTLTYSQLFVLFLSFYISFYSQAKQTASQIPERRAYPVNNNVNPCQDFYKYACSKVISNFKLREDRSTHTFAFDDSSERLLNKKKEFLIKLQKSKPKTEREEILKNYYSACMDVSARKKAENSEIVRISQTLINKINSREDFLLLLSNGYLKGETTPISWKSVPNQDHAEINDLAIETKYLSLPEKSYYKNTEIIHELENTLIIFFNEIGVTNPKKSAKVVLAFEKALAEVTPSPEELRQIVNNRNPITHEDLIKTYPLLKFEILINQIPKSTIIRHRTPNALAFLNTYFSSAQIDNLKDIYLYNSLKTVLDDAHPKFFNSNFEFNKKYFGGPNKRADRQERCARLTTETFSKEIDAILLPKLFPNFPREKFISLAEKIRTSIIESLEENKWLSSSAKAEAILKMKNARFQLVSPETEKEWDFLPLAKYSKTDAIQNEKTVTRVLQDKILQDLREPADKGRWMLNPLTVNAYYDAAYNKFVMPIGILQYPFYDPDLSEYENAGAVGAVIGHELGHAIDDQGSRFDSNGKLRQWMSMDDLKSFSERTRPLIDQFDAIGHNGRLTQGENIGDLVGLTAAYRSSHKQEEFQRNNKLQKELFLSWARVWCDVSRSKFEENYIKTDPHSLSFARVNEQIKQQPGFAKAFQCKTNDAMVLSKDKIVNIW